MAFDLTAQPQSKFAIRGTLQIPRHIRGHHGAAGKGYGNTGTQLQIFCMCCGYRQGQERILAIFLRRDAAESVRFHSHGGCTYSLEVVHRDTRINFHMSNLPTLVAFLLLFLLGALETVALHHGF